MLREMIGTYVAPKMRQNRFGQRNFTWNKQAGEIVCVFDVQSSLWNDVDREDFTLNVGLWIEPLWKVFSNKACPDFISMSNCFPDIRIGQLLSNMSPEAIDEWWTLAKTSDIEDVGSKIALLIEDKCLPFLYRFRTMTDVEKFIDSLPESFFAHAGNKLYRAALKYLCGDREMADHYFRELEKDRFKSWHKNVRLIKERL